MKAHLRSGGAGFWLVGSGEESGGKIQGESSLGREPIGRDVPTSEVNSCRQALMECSPTKQEEPQVAWKFPPPFPNLCHSSMLHICNIRRIFNSFTSKT